MEAISKIIQQMPPDVGTCPSSIEQMKADAINECEGSLSGYDCPICRNKGYVAIIREGSIFCRECECSAIRRSMRQIERSGLKSALESCTFDNYKTLEAWQVKAKQTAQEYITDCDGKWFIASGEVGSGKTHLCTAICGELLKACVEVRYMLWRDETVRLKASVNDSTEYGRLIDPLKTVKALYIDDFMKTERGVRPTTADINLAFEILNSRYANKKLITIISTEKSPEDLLDIDEAVGSRIFERSRGYCVRILGAGKNWRLK